MTLEEIAEVRPRLVDVTAEMLGRTPGPAYPGPAVNLRQLALAHADTITPVAWRQGTRAATGNPDAAMTSHFLAIRVRPANRDISRGPDGSLPDCWRAEHDYRELKTGLGLDHFEGRSFTGWHRHVTLATLAQAFCTLLRSDPKVPAPG